MSDSVGLAICNDSSIYNAYYLGFVEEFNCGVVRYAAANAPYKICDRTNFVPVHWDF
ncbi:MAG TPA: hypothetical protein VE956_23515 [Nodularia sp. (in: cyanobacteria)]|nr:hypothetical protein [Nodularia sp. (in: cyanobacteria)]